jgi:hypothetical protein
MDSMWVVMVLGLQVIEYLMVNGGIDITMVLTRQMILKQLEIKHITLTRMVIW